MADSPSPAIQECTTCGALLDITDEQPLALRHCPTCGAAMRVRRTFGPFELQEILGAGGMGSVYRARDATLHREVALKLLRPEHSQSQELIASFSKEAALTASINHPNVVKVYTTGTDHGVFFIAMELVDRGSLDELMMLQGKIGEAQILDVGIQVAQGLNAAYQRGLIHRDVKPGNILFADAHHAKIVDFGLAVLQEHANKDGGPIWGTPYYVAPEKLDTPPLEDFRSDIYSLGATLFHAAAGRPPFQTETASMVQLKQLKHQLISIQSFVPELSRTTAHVIDKMLHRFPARRFVSYEELIENLQYARDELLVAVHTRAQAPKKESTGWLTFGAAAVVVASGLALYHYRDHSAKPALTATATPAPAPAGPSAEVLHQNALDALAAGRFAEAATALRELDTRERTPQPLRHWISAHAALASLLAGQPAEAQSTLEKFAARSAQLPAGADEKLTRFFSETARLASGENPQPASAASGFDPASHEAFALLLLGVKNWSLGAFDEAAPLLAQFQNAAPTDSGAWLKTFEPIAASLAADIAALRTLSATAATDIAALEKAIESAKALRGRQTSEGKFTERLTALDAALTAQLAAAKEAKAMKETEMQAADAKLIAEALRGIGPAYLAFRFADATKVLAGVRCESEARQAELAGWLKRTEWLAQFKRTLVSDLSAAGYPQPLARRVAGSTVPNLISATDTTAFMKTPYGNVPVPWTDLTIESYATIAQTFARTAPPAEVADRTWRLGVFLYAFGKKPEGLAALRQAAEAQPDFAASLSLFPEN